MSLSEERCEVCLTDFIAAQALVYANGLEGRRHELECVLAEPLVVIDNSGTLHLADDHYWVMAAHETSIETMDAYVIVPERAVDLSMAKTAEKERLSSITDIEIVEYARHLLVETTKRL